jgi:hypothetical protein
MTVEKFRIHLKKVFSPDIGVKPSSQVLDMIEYVCGLILGLVPISAENADVEIASITGQERRDENARTPPYRNIGLEL